MNHLQAFYFLIKDYIHTLYIQVPLAPIKVYLPPTLIIQYALGFDFSNAKNIQEINAIYVQVLKG